MLDFYISSGRFLGPADERHVSLAVGPCYSYLYPVFESVACKTGQVIDPYDVAFFEGEALDVLEEAFAAA